MSSGLIAVYVLVPTLLLCCFGCVFISLFLVRREDARREQFNKDDWHIEGNDKENDSHDTSLSLLPKPILLARCFNTVGCGCGFSCLTSTVLWLMERFLIRPALKKSLSQMQRAADTTTSTTTKTATATTTTTTAVPAILCNDEARQQMQMRVDDLLQDIRSTPTMNFTSKVLNVAGMARCLQNHYGLLALAMKMKQKKKKSENENDKSDNKNENENENGGGVAQPLLEQEIVKEPIFIVSFPWTATTILHRTMALDREKFRNFDLCDMVAPLPHPIRRDDMAKRRALAERVQKELDAVERIFPNYQACLETITSSSSISNNSMHGLFRVAEAEEDLGWYDTGLGHMYMDFLILLYPEMRQKAGGGGDGGGGGVFPMESKECAKYRYAWLHMIMRIYQHLDNNNKKTTTATTADGDGGGGGKAGDVENVEEARSSVDTRPWLMRDPDHAAYLPELLQQFPDAKLIFAHGSPGDIVPSMAKLFVCFCSVQHIPGAPGTTSKDWGQETVRRMQHYSQGLVDFTKANVGKPHGLFDGSRRIDFQSLELAQDIPGAIAKIYAKFYPNEPGPSEQAFAAFAKYLKENEGNKRGNQRRTSLEDFHLTREDVAFPEYSEMFLSTFIESK